MRGLGAAGLARRATSLIGTAGWVLAGSFVVSAFIVLPARAAPGLPPAKDDVLAQVVVGEYPIGAALAAGTKRLYVANCDSSSVSVINAETNAVVATIPLRDCPSFPVLDQTGSRLYVTNVYPGSVSRVYVPMPGPGSMSVIDTNSNAVVASIPVGVGAQAPAVDSMRGRVYLSNADSVSVIDTNSNAVVASIPVGFAPSTPAVDSMRGRVYVAGYGTSQSPGTVSVIDTNSNAVIASIPVGYGALQPVLDPESGRVFVVNTGSDSVSVIDAGTNAVIATIPVGPWPAVPIVDPPRDRLYVLNRCVVCSDPSSLSVIDTKANAVIATIPIDSPNLMAYDPTHYRLYVTSSTKNSVVVVDTASNAVVTHLRLKGPDYFVSFFEALVVDPRSGRLYATDSSGGQVVVLKTPSVFRPASPQSLRIVRDSNAGVSLAWAAPAWTGSAKVTGYVAVASPGGRTCKTKGLTCTITGLRSGTPYSFAVSAMNRHGAGAPARIQRTSQ